MDPVWTNPSDLSQAPGVEAPKEVSVFARVRRRVTIGSCFFSAAACAQDVLKNPYCSCFTCCNLFLDCLQVMEAIKNDFAQWISKESRVIMALQAALNAAASMRLPILIALIPAEVKEAPKAKRLDFSVPGPNRV